MVNFSGKRQTREENSSKAVKIAFYLGNNKEETSDTSLPKRHCFIVDFWTLFAIDYV